MKKANPCYAHFLTVGAFGKRVPGDDRGSWRSDGEYVDPNGRLENYIRDRMQNPAVAFEDFERKLAFAGIADCCYKHGIVVGALNVQIDHFHILVYSRAIPENEIHRKIVSAASFRLRSGSPRFGSIDKIWQHNYNALEAGNSSKWMDYMRYVLEEQTDCRYMNEQEWLWRSSVWKSDPFDDKWNKRVEFDGRKITLVDKESAVKRTRPKEVLFRTKWN